MSRWLVPMTFVSLVACDEHEHPPDPADTEACGYLMSGPYAPVTATTAKDGSTPSVAGDHKAYTITLPATGVGYVKFNAPDAVTYAAYLDRDVKFAAQNGQSQPVAVTAVEDTAEGCMATQKKYTFELPAGPAFFALGPDAAGPFNLVADVAGHSHE